MMMPLDPDRSPERSSNSGRRRSTGTSPRPDILIADDHEATRSALRRLLESTGYTVATVGDGSEMLYELEPILLEEPEAQPPDLIVTDVRMPGLGVFRVAEQLRENGVETPFIVVTGYANDRIRHRVHRLDRAMFFEKPVDVDRLEEAVDTLVS